MYKGLIFLVAAASVAASAGGSGFAEAANPVPVTVYYESLCPDSIRFYINQLYPTMENANLSMNVDLQLVPYGKSEHHKADNGSWIFKCHHGDRECYGNKVHACALSVMTSKNERLTYLNCLLKNMLNNMGGVFPTEECAKQIPSGERAGIIECANSTRGDDLLAEMGNKTQMLQPKLSSVPTVVFNNKYDQGDFKQAQTNFKGVLCKHISYPKPAECSGTSGAITVTASLYLFIASLACLVSRL